MRTFQRFSTVKDIPDACFHQRMTLRGTVVSVSDGDTFRLRHMPLWRTILFLGKECQPYAKEAKAWLVHELKGAVVTVTLLRRDQYGRAGLTIIVSIIEYDDCN
ncbi:hypothetical protein DYB26_011124 [Aphanomyces astaci]|uniref:TNase-like domain-containing protein n=1 Tax=Aphanomyces astaci TaxID=112090 RepID=A0A3R7CT29_APHAT|nr:hypothetical protein DYB26_011124 [Aphanomyces astaci]